MKKILLISCFIMLTCTALSQKGNNRLIAEYEDTLKIIAHEIMYSETEQERRTANNAFITHLNEVLQYEKSFTFPFDSLITIARIKSPENNFRIFNWLLRKENNTYEYYGIIHYYNKKTKKYNLITLTDNSQNIRNPQQADLNNQNWYGGIIYDIISLKKNNKRYYTLLLWDGNDQYSIKKIIDIMYFSGANHVKFGFPIFQDSQKKLQKRIILEYDSRTSASMQYHKKKNQIIFDHLVARNKDLEGLYEYYIPDGTFNAYTYSKGIWLFEEDIDVRTNTKTKTKKRSEEGLFPR